MPTGFGHPVLGVMPVGLGDTAHVTRSSGPRSGPRAHNRGGNDLESGWTTAGATLFHGPRWGILVGVFALGQW